MNVENLVKKVVTETIAELKRQGFLKDANEMGYADVSEMLMNYYKAPEESPEITNALRSIETDYYFGIIPLYFQQHKTIEDLAGIFDVEVSTITRNKKRLCLQIYQNIRPS